LEAPKVSIIADFADLADCGSHERSAIAALQKIVVTVYLINLPSPDFHTKTNRVKSQICVIGYLCSSAIRLWHRFFANNYIKSMAMTQHILSRIAIFLLSIVLIVFGIEHFVHPRNMLIYVPAWIPGGLTWVYVVGIACILVAISFMINRMVKVTAYLLALLLLCFVFGVHLPNYLSTADPEYRQLAFLNILKDTALAAFALYIAANARHQRVLEETAIEEEVRKSEHPDLEETEHIVMQA